MRYCTRCALPETSAVRIEFDEKGVCSGCIAEEETGTIDYSKRWDRLSEIVEQYRNKDGSNYDCIIPVSGGKDSQFITYVMVEKFKMKPLLVTFNHGFNTAAGMRNLSNMISRFGCDHIRFTPNPKLIKKLSRRSLELMGDICWHCHCGIQTYPVKMAVQFNVPLIVWAEHGLTWHGGMFSHYDMVEMSRKYQVEHDLRGFEYEQLVSEEYGITKQDLAWTMPPSIEEIDRVGVRGIYLSNFMKWDIMEQTKMLIEDYGFETATQERTYNIYENVECHHCGGLHDYLKYLKFGYGRATDHVCQDIRHGRISREEGARLVEKYDSKRPEDFDTYLKWIDMTEEEVIECIEKFRDERVWGKDEKGKWKVKDCFSKHVNDPHVEEVRVPKKTKLEYLENENKDEDRDGYILL